MIDIVALRARLPQQLETLLRTGEIAVGIFVPARLRAPRSRMRDRRAAQLLVDGCDPPCSAAPRACARCPSRRAHCPRHRAAARPFELRAFYNPERRSAVNIVPA